MHHSTWDLEVHAREMQRRRLREAITARQIDEARSRSSTDHRGSRLSIPRVVSAALTWLSPRQSAGGDPLHGIEAAMIVSEGRPPEAVPRTNRLAQPYAGMVVLARGPGVQTAKQPCSVADC